MLLAGGALRRAFLDHEAQRQSASLPSQRQAAADVVNEPQGTSLIVEHEDSDLYYDGRLYRATQRRKIFNASQDPVTRYLIRISVDRYPGNPERSNQLYREPPLTWEELGLTASFSLPEDAEDARRAVAELNSAAERIASAHVFGKGMGIAAPQIGIDRAAAIIKAPDGEVITLLNPRIIDESPQTDELYEGCLSFFDVRGTVPRPLSIEVEHQDVDGRRHITIFENGMARLVAHEVDHLYGLLYTSRMHPGVEPIPVSEYRGTGKNWTYRAPQ